MKPTRRAITPKRHWRKRLIIGPVALALAILTSLTAGITAAAAQTAPADQSGLSVTGFGQASAPAETATIQIHVGDPRASAYAVANVSGTAGGGYAEAPVSGSTEVRLDPTPGSATANAEPAATPPAAAEGSVSSGGEAGGTVISEDKAPPPVDYFVSVEPLTEADLAPIVQALTTSGVPAEQIQTILPPAVVSPYVDPFTAGSARVDVTVNSPTVDGISALLTAVSNAAIANNLLIAGVGVGYDVADCQALREQAQRAALDDASAQAQSLAGILGVTLGGITFASEFSYSPTASAKGACAASSDPARSAGPGPFLPPFDPTQPAEAQVYSTLYLVYAIQTQTQ